MFVIRERLFAHPVYSAEAYTIQKKNTEALEIARRGTGLKVNSVKPKHMIMFPDHVAGQITT